MSNIKKQVYDLLELVPGSKPIYIVVKSNSNDFDKRDHYEEHTCPINYLRNIVEVFEGVEADPHGLFKYIESVQTDKIIDDTDNIIHEFSTVNKSLSETPKTVVDDIGEPTTDPELLEFADNRQMFLMSSRKNGKCNKIPISKVSVSPDDSEVYLYINEAI